MKAFSVCVCVCVYVASHCFTSTQEYSAFTSGDHLVNRKEGIAHTRAGGLPPVPLSWCIRLWTGCYIASRTKPHQSHFYVLDSHDFSHF